MVAAQLWAVYHIRPDAPGLILPHKRDGERRVSEQESKILITQWLQSHGFHYSIETPTAQQYRQSGQAQLSARIDVTVYGSPDPVDRILNVELKEGTADLEAFRKDFEKLLREQVPGLWFHTIESASDSAWRVVEEKMTAALDRVASHADAASHKIAFAFCVLDEPALIEFELNFSEGWRDRMGSALAIGRRDASRPDWRPLVVPQRVTSKPAAPSYSGSQRKLLVHMPSLEPSSLLHLSTKGDSYALRSFGGKRGYSRWKAPGLDTTEALLARHPIAFSIDVANERESLEGERQYWADRIAALNRVHGLSGV